MAETESQRPASALTDFRFGAIAAWGGLVERGALEDALRDQRDARAEGRDAPRIGEVLVERGLITSAQARLALRVQLQRMPAGGHLLFGRIATAKRFASAAAVERALDVQSREILSGGEARRLGRILVEAGDIRPEEVEAILAYQASRDSVPMSEAKKGAAPASEAPPPRERPVFLPTGPLGFVLDHSIWIACALAAAAAVLVAALRERIFG